MFPSFLPSAMNVDITRSVLTSFVLDWNLYNSVKYRQWYITLKLESSKFGMGSLKRNMYQLDSFA